MPDLSPQLRADLPQRRAWCRARRLTQHSAVFTAGETIRCPGVYQHGSGTRVICGQPRGQVPIGTRIILRRGQTGERCRNCGWRLEETVVTEVRLEATG